MYRCLLNNVCCFFSPTLLSQHTERYKEPALTFCRSFCQSRYGAEISLPRLRVKGLPYGTTEDDLQQFFKISRISSSGEPVIKVLTDAHGVPNGQAFLICKSKSSLNSVLSKKCNSVFRGRRIRLYVDYNDDRICSSGKQLLRKLDRAWYPKDNR